MPRKVAYLEWAGTTAEKESVLLRTGYKDWAGWQPEGGARHQKPNSGPLTGSLLSRSTLTSWSGRQESKATQGESEVGNQVY